MMAGAGTEFFGAGAGAVGAGAGDEGAARVGGWGRGLRFGEVSGLGLVPNALGS